MGYDAGENNKSTETKLDATTNIAAILLPRFSDSSMALSGVFFRHVVSYYGLGKQMKGTKEIFDVTAKKT